MLVLIVALQTFQRSLCTDVHHTAARYDTFFDRCTRSTQRVVHAVFLLFHLYLARSAHIQLCHTAGEFSQTLLQLLFVVRTLGSNDLRFDLLCTRLNSVLRTRTVNDRRVVFANGDRLCRTQHINRRLVQLDTFLLADHGTAGQNSDIFQHLFSAVTEARCFYRTDLQLRTKSVNNQRR